MGTDAGSGLDVFRFGSGGGLWDDWACGTPGTVSRTLTGGDGTKTLYLQCRDKTGNQTERRGALLPRRPLLCPRQGSDKVVVAVEIATAGL